MIHLIKIFTRVVVLWAMSIGIVSAGLIIQSSPAKTTGNKTVIKLDLKNTGASEIGSVRATVFLLDAQGQMVGQAARWILGGTKDRPGLAPEAKTTYNFVVTGTKPFAQTKLMVNRIVFADGHLGDVLKDVTIETETNR